MVSWLDGYLLDDIELLLELLIQLRHIAVDEMLQFLLQLLGLLVDVIAVEDLGSGLWLSVRLGLCIDICRLVALSMCLSFLLLFPSESNLLGKRRILVESTMDGSDNLEKLRGTHVPSVE